MKLVNIGFGNMINADRVISIISPESAPAKRIVQKGKEDGTLIDATHGRKTMSINVVLSYMDLKQIGARFGVEVNEDE